MKNYSVSTDLRRAIASKGFLMGLIGIVLMIAIAIFRNTFSQIAGGGVFDAGQHSKLILDSLGSDEVTLTLPIICTLPFTSAYVDDIKSGYIKQYLHRTGVRKYISGKLIACGVSGGLVLAIGLYLAYGISALVFTPMEQAAPLNEAVQSHFPEIFMKSLTLFFSGAFLSITGFTFSAMTMSRYMSYASPFVMYYLLIILKERYFKDYFVLYPKEWILQSQPWVLGEVGVWILFIELSAIMCFLFTITAKRRLENV